MNHFTQADSLIPGAGNPQAWNRYAYVLNNPLRYTDPSGHSIDCGIGETGCSPTNKDKNPWKKHPGYDILTESIPDWGIEQSENSRQERAAQVWEWICESGGWWGAGCPSARDLSAWLLDEEGAGLLNRNSSSDRIRGIRAMVGLFKSLFVDPNGITSEDLSRFTAFFNPEYGDGGAFNSRDWEALTENNPSMAAVYFVEQFWDTGPVIANGRIVDRWWDDRENFHQSLGFIIVFSVHIPIDNNKTLFFGYRP